MGVSTVARIGGSLVVDESVRRDEGADDEGWDTDTDTGEVVRDVVSIGETAERDAVLGRRNVRWWRNVVSETAMLVEVDDDESIVPVAGVAD